MNIPLLVLAGLLAAGGCFMIWVSGFDEATHGPLGPTRTVGVVAVLRGVLLAAALALRAVLGRRP